MGAEKGKREGRPRGSQNPDGKLGDSAKCPAAGTETILETTGREALKGSQCQEMPVKGMGVPTSHITYHYVDV